jgi:DNA-binding MarR family transcriptional regulator
MHLYNFGSGCASRFPERGEPGYDGRMDHTARDITELFETVSLGAPRNAVGFVMWRVMHRYQRNVDHALRTADLTHLQFIVLALVAWMSREGESATQSELARFGEIHPMQLSNVLKALELKRLVRRKPAQRNALAKSVELTPVGLAALRIALPLVIGVQRALFGAEGLPGGRLLEALVRIDRDGI